MKKITYKNSVVNFTDKGTGTPIILLHGYLENLSMWNFFIEAFATKHRIIAIDLLGHGATQCIGYIHTMEDNAAMVFSVLKNLKIKKAVFIGHSMGGYVALSFAAMFPKFLTGLVLLNSTSQADSPEKIDNRNKAIKIVKQNFVSFVRLSVANLFSPENHTRLFEAIENVKLEALKTPLQGIIAAQEGMKIRKDQSILLHTTQFPKLLVLGRKDAVLNYDETSEQTKNASVQLVTFSGGHMSHIENREELIEVLVRFLTDWKL